MEETSKKVRQTREIKFRAWNKYGMSYFTFKEVTEFDGTPGQCRWPEPTEIMQYTGLKDRTGKEIYEGDILKYSYDDGLLLWVVESNNFGGYSIYNINRHSAAIRYPVDSPSYFIDREIIGNIYEHPHLLSQGEIKTELI